MAQRLLTIAMMLLAGFGFFAAGQLVVHHLQTGETCPVILFVPLCVVVLGGYGAVLLSVITRWRVRGLLFTVGLAPVLLLASIGVASEVFVGETCPRTDGGVPQCYYSFGLAALILVLYVVRSIFFRSKLAD